MYIVNGDVHRVCALRVHRQGQAEKAPDKDVCAAELQPSDFAEVPQTACDQERSHHQQCVKQAVAG